MSATGIVHLLAFAKATLDLRSGEGAGRSSAGRCGRLIIFCCRYPMRMHPCGEPARSAGVLTATTDITTILIGTFQPVYIMRNSGHVV